jgi:hypothetical protein
VSTGARGEISALWESELRPRARSGSGISIWGNDLGGNFDVELTPGYRSTGVRLVWKYGPGPQAGNVRELARFSSGAGFIRFCESAGPVLDTVARVTDRVNRDARERRETEGK